MEFKKEPYAIWTNESSHLSYLFYKTKDNSISVSLKSENYSTELMHSVDGAFSETLHLYEDVVKYVVEQPLQNQPCVFLSLGLGLGYVEVLICAYFYKNFPNKTYKVFSFEKEDDLRCFFYKFIFDEDIPSVFMESYNHILDLFCAHYELERLELKNALKSMVKNEYISFYAEYNIDTTVEAPVNGLFFDAFSINTSPELWEDKLIDRMLSSCDTKAAFATYAARTHLKKLLLSHNFKLNKKQGYGGKKESTFACK